MYKLLMSFFQEFSDQKPLKSVNFIFYRVIGKIGGGRFLWTQCTVIHTHTHMHARTNTHTHSNKITLKPATFIGSTYNDGQLANLCMLQLLH